jgi:hypothetical protein
MVIQPQLLPVPLLIIEAPTNSKISPKPRTTMNE